MHLAALQAGNGKRELPIALDLPLLHVSKSDALPQIDLTQRSPDNLGNDVVKLIEFARRSLEAGVVAAC